MPSVREIKQRIQSVKNISQVTRALEAVSASNARRSQRQAERSRPYAEKAWEILINLSGQPGGVGHPLMTVHPEVKQIAMVLVTSDRGLAGAYNMNIIRLAENFVRKLGLPCRWITVGRKGRDYLARRKYNIVAEFSKLPTNLALRNISPIGDILVADFLSGQVDQVFVAYTDFVNVLTQKPVVASLLPLTPWVPDENMIAGNYVKHQPEQTVHNREYIAEPSANAILDEIVPRFTSLQLYQAILEASASEHAARMVAMRNASENAVELGAALTLEYNKARQLAITSEILDIVGGVEALKASGKKASGNTQLEREQRPDDYGRPFDPDANIDSPRADSILQQASDFVAEITSGIKEDVEGIIDDLQSIEGIGPQVEKALHAAGITKFAQLLSMSADDLVRIVKTEGKVRIVGSPSSWIKQAEYLVKGDRDGLQDYQKRLKGGKEV